MAIFRQTTSYGTSVAGYGAVPGSASLLGGAGGASGYSIGTSYPSDGITMQGTVKAADVMIDGVSMKASIEAINKRLCILVPDPAKLEKYESLKQAYEHYKTLEALIGDDNMPRAE